MIEDLKVGILGGGQLGAMLLRYAIDFGLDVSILEKDEKAPCARYTSSFHLGDPMSYKDVMKFGKNMDIITIEKEAVNTDALKDLRDVGVKVYPSPETIEIIQDKYVQKQFLIENNIPVANGWLVTDKAELPQHSEKLPACLKKCKDGYDGKGVLMLKTVEDFSKAFDQPSVLEELVDVRHELSVIVSRNEDGIIECYDPVMMIFDNERMILDFQMCPADIDTQTAAKACNLAASVAEAIDLTGIMAVEMFIATNGKLYVNELAPRPHNSGHHTIEANVTSQFEQHIRLILGLPPGNTKTKKASVMVNILEPAAYRKNTISEALKTILCTNDVHLHWYGKTRGKEGRKMGHVTITDDKLEQALAKSVMIRHLLKA